MSERTVVRQEMLAGERAMFGAEHCTIIDTIFYDGESPLKESHDLELAGCMFKWKYPLWYAKDVTAKKCTWFEMARAGVWYSEHISLEDCAIEAPKNFRRCRDLSFTRVTVPNAAETLWSCRGVKMKDVTAKGDYFAMNSEDMEIDGLTLYGNYSFDGAKNVTVRNSTLLSKDAFWNAENITVIDSFLSGEYLGWNSKNVTLIGCTIESLQGMCYMEGLVMKDCKTLDTTLAFEYSSVDAEIKGRVSSVFNPSSGIIRADEIGELTMDPARIDPAKTTILVNGEEIRP
ncbi:MAG: DUF3737 family protein [Clostridia bacterium]|nr:DUF3737 family protein [Clostridia bacterium]